MVSNFGSHHVKSLARGLAVIRAFRENAPGMTLSDVAKEAGMDRAAARRFVLTLQDLGYIRNDGRAYMLTPRVLELGYAYLSGLSLPEIASPHLKRLSATVNESCSLSVLDGSEIVYLARVATSRIFAVSLGVGARLPAHATSMGRVLLSDLPDSALNDLIGRLAIRAYTHYTITNADELLDEVLSVRDRGWAVVNQELEEGLRSVATPIRNGDGQVIAAINVSAHAARTSLADIESKLLPALLHTRSHIEQDLRMQDSPATFEG